MLFSKGVRWSATVTKNARQRSIQHACGARSFLINTHPSAFSRHQDSRLGDASRVSSPQQCRSISLFGWGSSPQPNPGFADVHAAPTSTPSPGLVGNVDIKTAPQVPTRPIKAVHETSDLSTTPSAPTTPVPQLLHDLENAVATSSSTTLPDESQLSAIPESLGYLKTVCGLDYGWGPTAFLEWTLEHIHIWGGLSWGASIAAIAVLSRLLVFRYTLQASEMSSKMRTIMPLIKPIRDQMTEAVNKKDNARAQELQAQMRAINKEYGFKWTKIIMPIVIQIPLSFAGFRLTRGMCAVPVPGLEQERWLWATDLTQADPFYVLPFVSAGLLYWNLKIGAETGGAVMQGPQAQLLRTIMPLFSFAFMWIQPGAVQLFFITTSTMAIVQTMLITNKGFRRYMQLPPIAPSTPTAENSATMAGGLNIYDSAPQVRVIEVPAKEKKNVSVIDRVVDRAKDRKDEVVGGWKDAWTSVWGKTEERMEKRQKDSYEQKANAYEAGRRREMQWERESRNKSKIDEAVKGKGGSGKEKGKGR